MVRTADKRDRQPWLDLRPQVNPRWNGGRLGGQVDLLGPTDYLALQTHTMTNPLVAAGHQSLPSRGPDRRGGRKNEGQRLPSVTRDLAGGLVS